MMGSRTAFEMGPRPCGWTSCGTVELRLLHMVCAAVYRRDEEVDGGQSRGLQGGTALWVRDGAGQSGAEWDMSACIVVGLDGLAGGG